MPDDPKEVREPLPLAYAGEHEAQRYRRLYRRARTVALVFGLVLAVIAGWFGYRAARPYYERLTGGTAVQTVGRPVLVAPPRQTRRARPPVPESGPRRLAWYEASDNPLHHRLAGEWRAANTDQPAGRVAYEEHPPTANRLRDLEEYGTVLTYVREGELYVTDREGEVVRPGLDFSVPVFLRWPDGAGRARDSKNVIYFGRRSTPVLGEYIVEVWLETSVHETDAHQSREATYHGTIRMSRRLRWAVLTLPESVGDQYDYIDDGNSYFIWQDALPPLSPGGAAVSTYRYIDDGLNAVRFFTGADDPDDSSRFSIGYEIGPPGEAWHSGEIIGRLLDDGTVDLRPTTGELRDGDWPRWQLPFKPR